MRRRTGLALLFAAAPGACGSPGPPPPAGKPAPLSATDHAGDSRAEDPATRPFAGRGTRPWGDDPREPHLRNVRQLTFEGENAEAYWSFDGTRLCFQHRGAGVPADQIYVVSRDGTDLRLVSTGTGKCTCSYFLPGDRQVLFASTHEASPDPPPPPDMSHGYTWAVHPTFDLFVADLDGGPLRRLAGSPGYDAEAVVSPDGKRIVFTSTRDGDLELYTMGLDGSDLRRVTREPGYDGGAFFSPDSMRLVYRGHHPAAGPALEEYRALLAQGLVRPTRMEILTSNADGSNRRRVTDNGKADFAPYFHPDGRRILFSSNMGDPKGREFDLWLVGEDGTGLERITASEGFDGFPMFSPDGKTLAFCSNRHGARRGETNVFLADWVE